jgi:hypothetical protein
MSGGRAIYVFGWDNLDVVLPVNVELEMSVQFEEAAALGDTGVISGSSRPGPNMRYAGSDFGNDIVGQPMATRIKVSN